jgi:hypothetical protein
VRSPYACPDASSDEDVLPRCEDQLHKVSLPRIDTDLGESVLLPSLFTTDLTGMLPKPERDARRLCEISVDNAAFEWDGDLGESDRRCITARCLVVGATARRSPPRCQLSYAAHLPRLCTNSLVPKCSLMGRCEGRMGFDPCNDVRLKPADRIRTSLASLRECGIALVTIKIDERDSPVITMTSSSRSNFIQSPFDKGGE